MTGRGEGASPPASISTAAEANFIGSSDGVALDGSNDTVTTSGETVNTLAGDEYETVAGNHDTLNQSGPPSSRATATPCSARPRATSPG